MISQKIIDKYKDNGFHIICGDPVLDNCVRIERINSSARSITIEQQYAIENPDEVISKLSEIMQEDG